ncbi:hypothetical protein UFOVP1562_55 [uncultured Caudovirales phage]|uniref:Uncharacterized protein n=1 Tax=uncultured Caudovirales phage TaxID=2100421 RepID=A0A6J7XL76_9CAUD|nr:hypothetical protein UFOVP1562_55 [uncultured Caudovirales phage]
MKAYPFIHKHPTTGNTTMAEGADLRDLFAGIALHAALSRGSVNYEDISVHSYKIADEMMRAREVKHD